MPLSLRETTCLCLLSRPALLAKCHTWDDARLHEERAQDPTHGLGHGIVTMRQRHLRSNRMPAMKLQFGRALCVATAIAAALAFKTTASDLEEVKDPVLVEVRPGGVVNVVAMNSRERQELATQHVALAVQAAQQQQGRLIAFQVRGGMLTSATLTPEQLQLVGAHLHLASPSDIAREYDRAMNRFLRVLLAETRNQLPGTALTIYGLPIEASASSQATQINNRFDDVLTQLDVFVSSHSMILGDGVNQLQAARLAMPQAFARSGERQVLVRINGQWRAASASGGSASSGGTTTMIDLDLTGETGATSGSGQTTGGTTVGGEGGGGTNSGGSLGGGSSGGSGQGGSSGGAGGGGGGQTNEFVPIRRRGLLVPCAGAVNTSLNPLGLRANQWRSLEHARQFYRQNYLRAEQLGIDRIIWHMPAGFQESGMRGRFAVLSVMGDRGEVFIQETRAFLDRFPNASIGVYVSAYMPQRLDRWRDEEILPYEPYDHQNSRHRAMVDAMVAPLVEAGIREIWLDNSAPTEYRDNMLALANYLRERYGVYTVFEGVPNVRQRGTTQRQLDMTVLENFAAMGIHRLLLVRDPEARWVIPAETEVIAVLTDHDVNRQGGSTPPTEEQVRDYIRRGFTIFSMSPEHDAYLALPTNLE